MPEYKSQARTHPEVAKDTSHAPKSNCSSTFWMPCPCTWHSWYQEAAFRLYQS